MNSEKHPYMWGEFYSTYETYTRPQNEYENILFSINRRFERAIDIGCGRGRHIKMLRDYSRRVDGFDLVDYGVDVDNFYAGDVTTFALDIEPYDLVFSNGLLHHFEKHIASRLLGHLCSAISEGSILIFNIHSKFDYKYKKGNLVSEDSYLCTEGREKGQIHCFWDEDELRKKLCSVSILKMFASGINGYSSWYVVAQKV